MDNKRNYQELFEIFVNDTLRYIKDYGLKTMVLGISGGIDSTVVAFVCHEISKRTDHEVKFIGVSLPTDTNGDEETSIAAGIGTLCDKFVTFPIQFEFEEVAASLSDLSFLNDYVEPSSLQLGNVKARLRMIYLYHIASMTGGVTMDTGNMTEHQLGFCTIHGDTFDLNCGISMLWKSEVYKLAWWLHENYEMEQNVKEFLERSINIAPTDGNGVTDGGDLEQIAPGMTYEQVDGVLCARNDEEALDRLRNEYPSHLVDGIIDRHKRTRYKVYLTNCVTPPHTY